MEQTYIFPFLLFRLSSDSQVIQNALSVNISMLLRYIIQILGSLIVMFITSPRLGGLLLAVVPLVGIGAQKYGAYTRTKQKAFQDEVSSHLDLPGLGILGRF